MAAGHKLDRVAGAASRCLHGLRGAGDNTLADFDRYYLDLPVEAMYPEPPPLRGVTLRRTAGDRVLRASTLSWRSTHEVLCPDYRQRHEGPYRSNLTAYARWIRPEGRLRRACMVYVHGWLEPGSWVEELALFPRWARELGTDIVHVSLPFHGRRTPKGALFSGELFWTADLVRSWEGIRQAIHDLRSILGWLRLQGYERVGASGVSLGGALAMMLACLHPLPDWVVPIVCHLDLGRAVEHASILSRMRSDLERWGIDRPRRHELFERVGLTGLMPRLSPDRQLWVAAREDAHIDPEAVKRQWEAWGRPRIHWIGGGHMTFPLHLPEITRVMATFLREVAT